MGKDVSGKGRGKGQEGSGKRGGTGGEKHGKKKGGGRQGNKGVRLEGPNSFHMPYTAVLSLLEATLYSLDAYRDARCHDCVTDNATHLAVADQVSHWLQ